MYSWANVASRTCRVYDAAMRDSCRGAAFELAHKPCQHHESTRICIEHGLVARLFAYVRCGTYMGPLMCVLAVWLHWWWCIIAWWVPANSIEPALDWPQHDTPVAPASQR